MAVDFVLLLDFNSLRSCQSRVPLSLVSDTSYPILEYEGDGGGWHRTAFLQGRISYGAGRAETGKEIGNQARKGWLFRCTQKPKTYKIFYPIESYGICMEH